MLETINQWEKALIQRTSNKGKTAAKKRGRKLQRKALGALKKARPFTSWLVIPIVIAIAASGYLIINSSFAGTKVARIREDRTPFIDISSPQCSRLNSIGYYNYGIVGLNGTYMNFGINPCLNAEVKHFRSYDVYVGANYPSHQCPRNMSAYNCGRKAASFNLGVINNIARIRPRAFWVDVESGPAIPWSTQTNNRAFLNGLREGMQRGLSFAGYYSNESMWNQITGNMQFSGAAWYATGAGNAKDAQKKCTKGFGGKRAYYVQYIKSNLDHNTRC